jgi:hypothetical protein
MSCPSILENGTTLSWVVLITQIHFFLFFHFIIISLSMWTITFLLFSALHSLFQQGHTSCFDARFPQHLCVYYTASGIDLGLKNKLSMVTQYRWLSIGAISCRTTFEPHGSFLRTCGNLPHVPLPGNEYEVHISGNQTIVNSCNNRRNAIRF